LVNPRTCRARSMHTGQIKSAADRTT
jgi:hypothetical protein